MKKLYSVFSLHSLGRLSLNRAVEAPKNHPPIKERKFYKIICRTSECPVLSERLSRRKTGYTASCSLPHSIIKPTRMLIKLRASIKGSL